MECDQPTLLEWAVNSLSSHDILYFEFPLEETILEFMASIDNPRDGENHQESILPSLEPVRVNMRSLDPRLGSFARESIRPPIIDPFHPWLSFSQLSTKFSTFTSFEYFCFVPPSCLDGSHQGVVVSQKTTPDQYLRPQKFIPMWHGPNMVIHMMPILAHDFIDYEKYLWHEPSHVLYLA